MESESAGRMTVNVLSNIDESLFLDKVKQFSTVDVGVLDMDNEEEKDDEDMFDIQQMGGLEDEGKDNGMYAQGGD